MTTLGILIPIMSSWCKLLPQACLRAVERPAGGKQTGAESFGDESGGAAAAKENMTCLAVYQRTWYTLAERPVVYGHLFDLDDQPSLAN